MTQTTTPSLDWYRDAKFGLFIHWGAYSVAGVEASWPIMTPDLADVMFGKQKKITEAEYVALPQRFNPVDFNADEWVRIAKSAGMRYVIFTAKHHDGFCMFDAPGTDYKITNTPFGRDICLELSQACARAGMPLGFYYSPPDLHHPGYRDTSKPTLKNWPGEPKRKQWAEYLDYMENHLRKLLTDYGEVSIIWFDGLSNHGKYDPQRFHTLIHSLSPGTLINDRLGDGYDFTTPEQFIPKAGIPVRTGRPPAGIDPGGDGFFQLVQSLFGIPPLRGWLTKQMQKYRDGSLELNPVIQEPYPAPERFQPWETCMTMATSWGYNPGDTGWKAPRELVRNLVEVTSRGGNYLLNIGPTDRGTFPPEAIERLNYIGKWMAANSEAVYGSTFTPIQGQPWGRATRTGNRIYLHLFDWPARLEIADFPVSARTVSLLSGEKLDVTLEGGTLKISLPAQPLDPDISVLAVDFDEALPALTQYSPPKATRISPQQFLKTQMSANFIINALINGLIAFATYRTRTVVPYAEAAIDILISVAIISFLVSWFAVGTVRTELIKGNIALPAKKLDWLKLPKGAASRAWINTFFCVIVFGGLVLDGLLYLIAPAGMVGWAYFLFKTFYTGASAAFADMVTILSVIYEPNKTS